MTPAQLDQALAAAVEAARAAGEVALEYYRTGFDVIIKADDTPVTQADRGAEQAIREVLGRAFPDVGVLGEEFGAVGDQQRRWIIDPIDGTKNFIRRIPVWATLIGLEEHGEVTAGVIHNPVTGELLSARRGGGVQYPALMEWSRWYNDLPLGDPRVTGTLSQLTPQPLRPWRERVDMRRFYAMRVPTTYVRCLADTAVPPGRAAEYAARLGVTPIDLACAHSPMLSAPDALTTILTSVAREA